MRSFIRKTFAAIILIGGAASVCAQQMPPLPTDPNVRIGKLDNGLTYYIRHNALPEKQADFYIAQKVGSILEEDNQRGLAHFLEHMCFNGTTNFPGNSLREYLESIGVKFGANLNAYTAIAEKGEIADAPALGFHIPGMFDKVLDIEKCWLQPDPSNAIREETRRFCLEHGYTFHNPREHRGLMRNMVVRTASTGEVMVIVPFPFFI
jgi:hypothetical protein